MVPAAFQTAMPLKKKEKKENFRLGSLGGRGSARGRHEMRPGCRARLLWAWSTPKLLLLVYAPKPYALRIPFCSPDLPDDESVEFALGK